MRIATALALLAAQALAGDLAKAREEAAREGKPMMVVFRCVP